MGVVNINKLQKNPRKPMGGVGIGDPGAASSIL